MKFPTIAGKNSAPILVDLKDSIWLERQRIAGKCVAKTLSFLESSVKELTTKSMLELSYEAEKIILDAGCTATFKGYKGFPEAVCISVNKQLVHGIPTDYKLQPGDVVSFDLGATYEGAIADSAITCIYGEPNNKLDSKIIDSCKNALYAGIKSVKVGSRLGVIGNTIYKSIKKNGYSVIIKYSGHGLSYGRPHSEPAVYNKSELNEGIRIQPGLTIAIEPMVVPTDSSTAIDDDGWTVSTKEIGAHWEHTIFVHADNIEVITLRDGEII